MKTKSQFRGFTPWHITQIPNSIFTPYMEIGSSPTSGSNLRLVSVLKKTPSHQRDPNQCLTYVCLIDYSWTDWPAGWQAHQLAYCLPEKTEHVEGWRSPDSIPSCTPVQTSPLHLPKKHVLKLRPPWSPFPGLDFLTWLWRVYRIRAFDATKTLAAFLPLRTLPVTLALRRFIYKAQHRADERTGSRFAFFWRVRTKEEEAGTESRSQSSRRNQVRRESLTQVADLKGMKGAIRIPVSRPMWDSGKLSQTLNQEGVNGREGIDGSVPLNLSRGRLCGVCQFPWCKYSHCSLFQATNVTSTTSQKSWRFHSQLRHVCISQLQGGLNRVHGQVSLAQGWLGGRQRQWQQERPLIRD